MKVTVRHVKQRRLAMSYTNKRVVVTLTMVQSHRKRWTGFETVITYNVLDGFTRLES